MNRFPTYFWFHPSYFTLRPGHTFLTEYTKGKTITLKVKYTDFQQITRSKTVDYWIDSAAKIEALYPELVALVELDKGVRLLGLTLSNLNHDLVKDEEEKSIQLTLEF